jgi:hypothetical protein
MKPNVVLGILLAAALVAGGVVYLKRHSDAPAPPPAAVAAPAPQASTASLPPPLPLPSAMSAPAPTVTPDEEIDHLQEWSRSDDPQDLTKILADLTNTNKDVREGAIEAAKQFGSTNAIPALKAAAFNSSDPDEQVEMIQAAQFLTLPPLDVTPPTPEQIAAVQARIAQNQAAHQARTQAAQQQQGQTQGQGQNADQAPAPQSPQQ